MITRQPRKLSRMHFAFMRSLAQGLDARTSWDRYMGVEGDSSDRRAVARVVKWVREEFAIASTRLKRPGTARLWRFDESKITEQEAGPQQPSLDEFVAQNGWEDFSEEDQLFAYTEAYGAPKIRKNGRARFIARQLRALAWLEVQIAQDPAPSDSLSAWLAPAIAKRLEAAGLPTLFALSERINGIGAGWYRNITGIGSRKAARIVEWMKAQEVFTGLKVEDHVFARPEYLQSGQLDAIVTPATALRPLEKFVVPRQLDGSEGRFRAARGLCGVSAKNDYEAIQAWLHSKREGKAGSPSPTQRAYRKEAERLILWSILECGKPISSITVEDATAYMHFLSNPPSHWCGPRHRQRWSPLWRPLEGPLQASAKAQTITILQSLYTWLNSQNYLTGNPFAALTRPLSPKRQLGSARTLSVEHMKFFLREKPDKNNGWAALALRWLYSTGLRQAEMVDARCGDLIAGNLNGVWLQNVEGKGGRLRVVPVPEKLIMELSSNLEKLGLSSDPTDPKNSSVPIISPTGLLPVSRSGLYKSLKRMFEARARDIEAEDPALAARLRKASTHWLRHSHASHLVNGDVGRAPVSVHIVRENLGHASLTTTTSYLNTEINQRIEAMQEFLNDV